MKEAEVSMTIGVPMAVLRQVRADNLYEEEDFRLVKREIHYTDSGVKKVRRIMGLDKPTPPAVAVSPADGCVDGGSEKEAAPRGAEAIPEPPRLRELRILRLCPNPIWVDGTLDGGERVYCRVRFNRGLRVGNTLSGLVVDEDGKWKWPGKCPIHTV